MSAESNREIQPWWRRPTIQGIKREQARRYEELNRDPSGRNDAPWPTDEALDLVSVVLVRLVVPSEAHLLEGALRVYPGADERFESYGPAASLDSRRRRGGTSIFLSSVRRKKHWMNEGVDPTLPVAFTQVNTVQFNVTDSLTAIVAAFALSSDAGDLSAIVHASYPGGKVNVSVRVQGRLRRLRTLFSRPRDPDVRTTISMPRQERGEAVEVRVNALIRLATEWFEHYFSPSEHHEVPSETCAVPAFQTRTRIPFSDDPLLFMTPLDRGVSNWKERDQASGWRLRLGSRYDSRSWLASVAKSSGDDWVEVRSSEFGHAPKSDGLLESHFEAFAWLATIRLLDNFAGAVAAVRDSREQPLGFYSSLLRYPRLGRFMSLSALDIATVAREIAELSRSEGGHRAAFPEYVQTAMPPDGGDSDSPSLASVVVRNAGQQATRLQSAATDVIENLRASSQFHQALTNQRLQAGVVVLSIVVVVLTVFTLVRM